jgi:DNA-binding MarR family transcriptional regulator
VSSTSRVARAPVAQGAGVLAIHEFASLVAINARSSRQRDRVLRAAGVPLTGANLDALRTIERHGPMAMSDVARRLRVDQSTATRQVRPLEDQGLVARTTDLADRRIALVALTPDGVTLLARVTGVALHDYETAMGGWSAADREQLGVLLDRLRHDLLAVEVDESGWSIMPGA